LEINETLSISSKKAYLQFLKFQILAAANRPMEMTAFWVVVPSSLVEVYRRFRGACYPIIRLEDPSSAAYSYHDNAGSKYL
jgi:hypothetical protein